MASEVARPPVEFEVDDLGRIGYREAQALQEGRVAGLVEGRAGQTLFLLEHPHVVTLGRNARSENVLVPEAELEKHGVEIHECSRGGDVTYHGPGQLVGYPVLKLPEGRRSVHGYVRDLEEALIRTLADFGIEADRDPGFPGVWVGRQKVAALGVRISRWVTSHGFALNVSTDLTYFRLITPCGLQDRGVTTMELLLGRAPDMNAVKATVARRMREVFSA